MRFRTREKDINERKWKWNGENFNGNFLFYLLLLVILKIFRDGNKKSIKDFLVDNEEKIGFRYLKYKNL